MSVERQFYEMMAAKNTRVVMKWTDEKDLLLCQDIQMTNPFRYKRGTQCRGNAWKLVAGNLAANTDFYFKVDNRSVRDRWNLLRSRVKSKLERESREGISTEPNEIEKVVVELMQWDNDVDFVKGENDSAKIMMDELELRKRMEVFAEAARKRPCEESDEGSNKRQNTETLEYLRMKMESDAKIKQDELDLKKREQELAHETQQQIIQQVIQQQNSMLTMMTQQMELTRQLLLVLSKKT